MTSTALCPFIVGDTVVFTPSERTRGLYQDISLFSICAGEKMRVAEVRDGIYLYGEGGIGGWPWNEFTQAKV